MVRPTIYEIHADTDMVVLVYPHNNIFEFLYSVYAVFGALCTVWEVLEAQGRNIPLCIGTVL